MSTQLQLYGQFHDWCSFSTVSRGIARAFKRNFVSVGIYETGTMVPSYIDAQFPIVVDSMASVGLAIAYPPRGIGWLEGHEFGVLASVCEANQIPMEWVTACAKADLITVPSEFCKAAFEYSGVRTPIVVVHHGVDERTFTGHIRTVARPDTAIRLLHVSGAVSFPQRKGTPQLLIAFKNLLKDYPTLQLLLKMPNLEQLRKGISSLDIDANVKILPNASFDPTTMRQLYESVDLVVQPSRGEGFGMCPLEARCAGTPVVLTNVTGHREHFAPGVDTEVETGRPELLKTQGNEIGSCPTVSVEAVEAALRIAIEDLPRRKALTRIWAQENTRKWTWPAVIKPLLNRLRKYTQVTRAIHAGEDDSVRGF